MRITAFVFVFEVWMGFKEFSDFRMTSFNELVIGSSQGFAFLLKIITEMFENDVNFKGHCLAMISHKCEPSVSEEFNLFSVVDFYCVCVCHSVDFFDLFQSINKCVQILWQEFSQEIEHNFITNLTV